MELHTLTFSTSEILSLLGLMQCLYILVYMVFRAGEIKRSLIPFAYFFILATAFFFDVSERFLSDGVAYYPVIQWSLWNFGTPLCVLLIIQIARIYRLPRLLNIWLLFLIPISIFAAFSFAETASECSVVMECQAFWDGLKLGGLVSGALALVSIWVRRNILDNLYKEKSGKDRYWLILTLITVNIIFLIILFLDLTGGIDPESIPFVRSVLGIALAYVAGTSLFRIYPQALVLVDRDKKRSEEGLNDNEKEIGDKIQELMDYDKVYQDPRYSRAQLAQELGVSEAQISKIINLFFNRSFPQLLNEKRVEDAKRLLQQTDAPVRIIAAEVGFNSISSFNRIFRDMTGLTPSVFRETVRVS